MPIVEFNPTEFKELYPEFTTVADVRLDYFFLQAGMYLKNTDASPVQNLGFRKILLYLLTAHIALLQGALAQDNLPTPVGRVNSAQEGSVMAEFDYKGTDNEQWYIQTQYGAAFWQATRGIRTMHYFNQNQCNSWALY